MTTTDIYRNGVIGVIKKIRLIKPVIGTYEKHFQNQKTEGLTVKLSNGLILMPVDMARDFEEKNYLISETQYKMIANTFQEFGAVEQ